MFKIGDSVISFQYGYGKIRKIKEIEQLNGLFCTTITIELDSTGRIYDDWDVNGKMDPESNFPDLYLVSEAPSWLIDLYGKRCNISFTSAHFSALYRGLSHDDCIDDLLETIEERLCNALKCNSDTLFEEQFEYEVNINIIAK